MASAHRETADFRVSPVLILVLSCAATFWLWHSTTAEIRESQAASFHNRVALIKARIVDSTSDSELALLGASSLFTASAPVTRPLWRNIVQGLEMGRMLPGVLGIAFVQRVPAGSLSRHIEETRAEGFATYTVFPEGARDEYFPVRFIEPFHGRNLQAFGYDVFSEPVRRAAMERARDEGRTIISGILTLVQEGAQVASQRGLLMFHPVYAGCIDPASVAERRQSLIGYVDCAIRFGDFLDAILFDEETWVGVSLYDGEAVDPARQAYTMTDCPKFERVSADHQPAFEEVIRIAVCGRTWTLRFFSLPSFERGEGSSKPYYVLAFGVFTSFLLTGLAFVLRSRRRAILTAAELKQSEEDLLANRERLERMVTERTGALRDSEERYRVVIEKTGQIVYEMDVQSGMISNSGAIEEVTGYSQGEFATLSFDQWLDGIHHDDRERLQPMLDSLLVKPGPFTLEYRFRRKDGEYRFILDRGVVLTDGEGKKTRLIGTMADISERRRLEEEQQRKNAELEAAWKVAEQASRAKSDFVANVSHELRTPLNAVLGFAGLALKTGLSPVQEDYLRKIQHSGGALLAIINDILDFSKIEAGRMALERIEFSLETVFSSLLAMFGPQAEAKRLSMTISGGGAVPSPLVGDPLRLGQILANLVSNALKFTESGTVELTVVHHRQEDGVVRLDFQVRDSGIGMTQGQLEGLFQPFVQADLSTTRKYGGTGLGLVISKRLIELMGGSIAVESSPGQGSVVSFSVVLAIGRSRADDGRKPTEADPADDQGLEGLSVLVVEDNALNQQITRALLESAGASVRVAANGREALEVLSQATGGFDAVLMDVQMPEMDGYEAARRIRQMPSWSAIPIIAMTAHAMAEAREHAADAGMNAHLPKPITPRGLFQALRDWTNTRSGRGPEADDQTTAVTGEPDGSSRSGRRRLYRPTSTIPPIGGVDVSQGLARLAGDAGTYLNLLKGFPVAHRGDLEQLGKALAEGDAGRARSLAHLLKGLAGNLSLSVIARAAADLETALASACSDESLRGMERLREAFDRFAREIDRVSLIPLEPLAGAGGSHGNGRESAAEMSAERALELMTELRQKLAVNDFKACKIFGTLKAGFVVPESCRGDFATLEATIVHLQFDEALKMLARIEEAISKR